MSKTIGGRSGRRSMTRTIGALQRNLRRTMTSQRVSRARDELLALVVTPEFLAELDEHVRDVAAEAVREELARQDPKRRWLTIKEAAEQMSCSYDAMRMLADRGRVKTEYQGRRRYIDARSLRELDGR